MLQLDTPSSPLKDTPSPSSELHGMICGLVCAGSDLDGKVWMERILGQINTTQTTLIQMYNQVSHEFNVMDIDLQPLLPDDEHTTLGDQLKALQHWCEGFLFGLYTAGFDVDPDGNTALAEGLGRFNEITRLDLDAINTQDEDREAFSHLLKYLREAIRLFYLSRFVTKGRKALH